MDTSKLCMYCMQDNGGKDVCPHCGKDANAPLISNHLTPGEVIGGRFVVGVQWHPEELRAREDARRLFFSAAGARERVSSALLSRSTGAFWIRWRT